MAKHVLVLGMTVALTALAGVAEAVTYGVESFSPEGHSISVPGIGQSHLHFDPGATLEIEGDLWTLSGELTSATDGTRWALDAHFASVLSDSSFGPSVAIAALQDGGLTSYSAETWYELVLPPDITVFAFLGPGMNDRNDRLGLSTSFELVEYDGKVATGIVHHGEINLNVSAVPEPNAALVFAVGVLLVGGACRSRRSRRA